jgi:hypothetical protein
MSGGPFVPEDPAGALAAFLDSLRGERLLFFPVRHHSPACAWHLRQLIREARPASVMIEGPETFDRFVVDLQRAETVPPVAIYTHVVERQVPRGGRGEAREERRIGSFYPLCDYSPELVALREAAAVGARVGFCDLDYPRQVRCEEADLRERRRLTSLLSEAQLQESAYLRALAKRHGCRDPHELWDRLFESRFREIATHDFVRQVAAYCWFARAHAPAARLERDGTVAREAHMAARIHRELTRLRRAATGRAREAGSEATGPLMVVTGGFHTPALALGWARSWKVELPPPAPAEQVLEALIPYGFAQLDALNGYAAGMPSPGFYQRLWETAGESAGAIHEAVALDLLTELPARLRKAGASLQLSTADAIAAFAQAVLLARARGNDGPAREDLLDGMRSCFVKGELDVEGQLVLDLALELMRGDRVGRLPPDVKLHPLVADFRAQAEALRLERDTGTPRELALEIYRRPRHRQISRLFHRLAFLDVPYARCVGGPDFVMGRDLDLQIERWECAWSPLADGALIEKGLYGSTIEQACVALLREHLERLEEEHGEVGALEAVRAVTLCLRLDLGEHLPALVGAAHARLAAESSLGQCAEAAAQLQALVRLPGPFAAGAAPDVERLAIAAYERSCLLVRDLPRCPPAGETEALAALTRLRELVVEAQVGDGSAADATAAGPPDAPTPAVPAPPPAGPGGAAVLDAALLWPAARAALADPGAPEAIRGGLAGLLFACGQLPAAELEAHVLAGLQGIGPQGSTAPAYLHGLFTLCREITWQFPAIVRRIDELLGRWDDQEFDRALPFLRLAFAQHTPRETDRVALLLKELHGSESPLDWYSRLLDEAFVHGNVALAARVEAALRRDGLGHFLAEPVPR